MATTISSETASASDHKSAQWGSQAKPPSLEKLYALGRKRTLVKQESLTGVPNDDRLVFVENGAAKLLSQKHILTFQFPGDVVSIPKSSADDFALVALTDLECVTFRTKRLLDCDTQDALTSQHILKQALRALHSNRIHMMQMQHQSAKQRLAEFLLNIAQRLGSGVDRAREFSLPMSRGEIAASLGLTIETVSRQFRELRDTGLIATQGRSIIKVSDLDALNRYAKCEAS